MLLILFSWFYIFFICVSLGTCFHFFTKQKASSLTIYFLLGLFFQLIFIKVCAICIPINKTFYVLNFILGVILWSIHRKTLLQVFLKDKSQFLKWSKSLKFLLVVIFLAVLIESSSQPYIFDNESYYIQTIKWLNEYGFVKGLANLHIFLAQTSGLHILQASFNFSFLTIRMNDINGVIFIIMIMMSLNAVYRYQKNDKITDLVFGLLPLSSVFMFKFLSSPSPDLPIFIISQYAFMLFYQLYKKYNDANFLVLVILVALLIMVKVTVFVMLFLVAVILYKYRKDINTKLLLKVSVLFFLSFSLFVIKNAIISGYPLYPLPYSINVDWSLPLEIQNFYYKYTSIQAYLNTSEAIFNQLSLTERFLIWFNGAELHGIFNKTIVVLLLVLLFVKKNDGFKLLYVYSLMQFFILCITSPQYRFFFHLIIIFLAVSVSVILHRHRKMIIPLLYTCIIVVFIAMIFSSGIESRILNIHEAEEQKFSIKQVLVPQKNSKYNFEYTEIKEGNLLYNSPTNNGANFWLTSDGPLPTVSQEQVMCFSKYYNYSPQLRKTKLKDGFKMISTNKVD